MKQLILALMVVLSLFAVPTMADSDNYSVSEVSVDGIVLGDADSTITVERGQALDLEVTLKGESDPTDVQVKAWIGGYEHSSVQATSSMFDVEDGVSYKVNLNLEMPQDLEAGAYTLYVEVFDGVESETNTYTVLVSKARHLVNIQDVLVDDAEAGDRVSATVRLENMGDRKEEDIKVTVSITELGIQTSKYLDELVSVEDDSENAETSDSVTLSLQIPADAVAGDYTMNVVVSYDNGYETTESSQTFHVDAKEAASTVTLVVVDSTTDSAETGDVVADATDSTDEESNKDFSTALRLGFGILAVLVVVLALILVVRK